MRKKLTFSFAVSWTLDAFDWDSLYYTILLYLLGKWK
jgi:hypothetical protein